MRERIKYLSIIMSVLFILGIFYLPDAESKEQQEEIFKKKIKVAILPVKDFRMSLNNLFYQDILKSDGEKITSRINDYIVHILKSEEEIEVISGERLIKQFLSNEKLKETEVIIRGFLHLGEELYKNLQVKEASSNLEKGRKLALDLFIDVFEPAILADIMFFLGLSYLEMGKIAEAHIALKMMYFIDPERKFKKDYYPKLVEEALDHALMDFIQTYNKEMAMLSLERMDKFLSDSGFHAVIYSYIDKGKEGSVTDEIHMLVYEKQSHGFTNTSNFPLNIENGIVKLEELRERIERFLSQWKTCVTFESGKLKEEKQKLFFLDVGGSHSLYIKYPTRHLFNNIGFGANFSAKLRRNFDIFIKTHFITSIADKYKDLINNFNSVRVAGGAGFEISGNIWRVFFHPGIDFQFIGILEESENPFCKWDRNHPMCLPKDVVTIESQIFIGILASLGMNVIVLEDLYIAMQTGFSAYFYPFFKKSIPLNFPVSFDLGIGYSF